MKSDEREDTGVESGDRGVPGVGGEEREVEEKNKKSTV